MPLPVLGCMITWLLALPFFVLYVLTQLVVSLLELPRFVHRWLLHPSNVLESEYHPPQAYALITGASDGIGRALAEELAHRGWNLILHGRNPTKLDALADHLRALHPTIDTRVAVQDTSHPMSFPHLFAHNLVNLSGPITVLINNVGTQHSALPFCTLSKDEITTSLSTNITFPTLLTHHLLSSPIRRRPSELSNPLLLDEASPLLLTKSPVHWELRCIINISCLTGLHGTKGTSVHAATKSYLAQLSRGISADEPRNIEILTLLVGHTRTRAWRQGGKSSLLIQDVQSCVRGCLGAVGLGKRAPRIGVTSVWWWGGYDLLNLGRGDEGVFVHLPHELWVGLEHLFPARIAAVLAAVYDGVFERQDAV